MNSNPRIQSIYKTNHLDKSITGFSSFDLAILVLEQELNFALASNLRLGHLAEKVVADLIRCSSNYRVLDENIQIVANKTTIGELDFIVEDIEAKQLIHLEFAYKFYLFDPNISGEPASKWIGPNRNDSLSVKLDKLKTKQFPLLYHPVTQSQLSGIDVNLISQSLCLLASLFLPYGYRAEMDEHYQKSIKGYYLDLPSFCRLDDASKLYYLPSKLEWGIEASQNTNWRPFSEIKEQISICISEKQSPLIWQKQGDSFLTFFIVWW